MQIDNSWLQHKGTREEGGSSNNNGGRKAPSIKIPYPPPHPKCAVRKDHSLSRRGENAPKKKSSTIWAENFFRLETQAGLLPPLSNIYLPPFLFSRPFTQSIFFPPPPPLTPTHLTAGANWRRRPPPPPPRPVMGRRRNGTG